MNTLRRRRQDDQNRIKDLKRQRKAITARSRFMIPDWEKELVQKIRSGCESISCLDAQEVFKEKAGSKARDQVRASREWCKAFRKRHNLIIKKAG